MTAEVFEHSVRNTLGISCMFMWIILAALGFGAVFDGLGAVRAIDNLFTEQLGLNPWMILIMMQLSFILMGTFLDDTAMLVIVAPLYVPLVRALEFDLIWYGVLYTITTQIAYMTPPFGYNLFLMRAMAPPEIGLGDIYRSIIPVCRRHDPGACADHGLPRNRPLASELHLRQVGSCRQGPHGRRTQKAMSQVNGGRRSAKLGERKMTQRRDFLKKAGAAGVAGAATATLAAPAVHSQTAIKWRLQTYAGPALAEHVIKPAIDSFNKVANGEMEIELYTADQLVPTGELFRAMQNGTIDAVQSDDDSMASPTEVTVFGGYFPFASRYSLDVPVLFNQWGLGEIWDAEYSKVGVKHGFPPAPGIPAISPPRTRSTASPTWKASASSPSRPPVVSSHNSAWCR